MFDKNRQDSIVTVLVNRSGLREGRWMIEELSTGRLIAIRIFPVSAADLRRIRGWFHDWVEETFRSEVFGLSSVEVPDAILGLMAISREVGFVEVKWLENSPTNVGRGKAFGGIAGSLLGFAADLSRSRGDDGFVKLKAKSKLIDHYRKHYGFARQGRSQEMILYPDAAARLIAAFFKEP